MCEVRWAVPGAFSAPNSCHGVYRESFCGEFMYHFRRPRHTISLRLYPSLCRLVHIFLFHPVYIPLFIMLNTYTLGITSTSVCSDKGLALKRCSGPAAGRYLPMHNRGTNNPPLLHLLMVSAEDGLLPEVYGLFWLISLSQMCVGT